MQKLLHANKNFPLKSLSHRQYLHTLITDMPLTYGCVQNENGWRNDMICTGQNGWYECQCCPYGYHIDLDFVRYCETFGSNTSSYAGHEPSVCGGTGGSTKRRRQDRRRQRQSMEVLLGLVPNDISLLSTNVDNNVVLPTVTELPPPTSVDDIRNSLNDVVQEFELTLQRTKGKRNRNLPDVTAVNIPLNNNHIEDVTVVDNDAANVVSAMAPQQQQQVQQPDERDFDAISIESATNLSPGALQNIRTQMALSLERTRHLEDMVKGIPALQEELEELKLENSRLVAQCRYWENAAQQPPQEPPSRPPLPQHNARDAAVLAAVLTRTVAVGSHVPLQRTASTQTPPLPLEEPVLIISTDQKDRTTQTSSLKHTSKQTQASPPLPPPTFNRSTQSTVEVAPLKISVAVSDDTILEDECTRCIQLEQELVVETSAYTTLVVPPVRTVSIAVGTEQVHKLPPKTQASQATAITLDKSQQVTEPKTMIAHKMIQSESVNSVSKHTQHKPAAQSKAIQTTQAQVNPLPEVNLNALQTYQAQQQTPSRIPVPRTPPAPSSPTQARAFRRQDTYTKLPTDDKATIGLSSLDLGSEATSSKSSRSLSSSTTTIIEQQETTLPLPTTHIQETQLVREDIVVPFKSNEVAATIKSKPAELEAESVEDKATKTCDIAGSSTTSTQLPTTFEKFESKFILPKVIASSPKPQSQQTPPPPPPPQPLSGQPSREMQAAVKVLNDSLERGNSVSAGALAPHLRTAHQLIEREWFRVSSLVGADPLHVEAYLDHLDAVGGRVLEYVVNMVDSSGNTAMHYSVSHGNFDVVSILLDSKVCDVNRQNLAGYTSLMLVSLAEVRSSTHASVVRRLFSLGDVNVRARGHGQTALMLAVSHGRDDMVAMLLSAGADVNIQDDDGSTALMCAAEHGHVEIVRQFLGQPDCDSRVTDVDGCTALRIAMDAGHRHIGVLLYAHERRLLGPSQSGSGTATPSRRRSNSGTSTSAVVDKVSKREEDSSHM